MVSPFRPTKMLDAALALAAKNWPVFPCNPDTKQPLVRGDRDTHGRAIPNTGGVKKATTDPTIIRDWWRATPRAMIAIATGLPIGAFVLDIDACTDETGKVFRVEELDAELEREIGVALTPTVTSATPRGGRHRLYRVPDGFDMPGNRNGLCTHIDVRGTGGYIIAPPSIRGDGKAYEWLQGPNAPIAVAPAPLVEFILRLGRWSTRKTSAAAEPMSSSTKSAASASVAADAGNRGYALTALDNEKRKLATAAAGQRNDALF